MKIELDTKNKTITIKEPISFQELVKELSDLINEDQLKEYSLLPFKSTTFVPFIDYPVISLPVLL